MNAKSQARQVIYSYGMSDAAKMELFIQKKGRQQTEVCVDIQLLFHTWKTEKEAWLREVMNDPPRAIRVLKRADRLFIDLPIGHPDLNKVQSM